MLDKATLRKHYSKLREQCTYEKNEALINNLILLKEYQKLLSFSFLFF